MNNNRQNDPFSPFSWKIKPRTSLSDLNNEINDNKDVAVSSNLSPINIGEEVTPSNAKQVIIGES